MSEPRFNRLDSAARANLAANGVREYERYKAELMASGEPPDSIEEILTGFIWDASEDDEESPAVVSGVPSDGRCQIARGPVGGMARRCVLDEGHEGRCRVEEPTS